MLQWLLSEAGISSSSPLVTREAGQQVQKANKSSSVQGKGTEQSWHQTVSTLLAKVSTQLWIPAASFCLGAKLPKLTVPHRSCLCTQATDALGRVWGGTQPHFSPQCPLFAAQAAPLQSPVTTGRHCSQLTLRCISSAEPGRGLKKKIKEEEKKKKAVNPSCSCLETISSRLGTDLLPQLMGLNRGLGRVGNTSTTQSPTSENIYL